MYYFKESLMFFTQGDVISSFMFFNLIIPLLKKTALIIKDQKILKELSWIVNKVNSTYYPLYYEYKDDLYYTTKM